ncbi:MAG TPA: glycosyltransferase family A protein, partial [Magnetospirillaceae bacterium]|nr:glycosyltransferase family A protein [Magnetospirillaceae bacterium]
MVVIPVARYHARLARCLEACSRLTYEPRTVCVVSDKPLELPDDPHFINVVTGAGELTGPGAKRDIATLARPDAAVYAYLDDDAYPPPQWLDEAATVLGQHPDAAGA